MGREPIGNTVKRLIWLLDTIHSAGEKGISREEISRRWRDNTELSGGEDYARDTFTKHIGKYIPDIFDVEIECIRGNKYRIKYPEDMGTNDLTGWMVETISLKNMIVGNSRLRNRVLFEPVPAGQDLIRPIVGAIDTATAVKIKYQRFHEDSLTKYTVEPYFLKLFRRRWYLVGLCREMGRIYTFALDRVQDMSRTEERFAMPETDEIDLLNHSFGINWSSDINPKPVIVKIRVYGEQADYIRSLPLHSSQKQVGDSAANYTDFEYYLLITYDFVQELLSHGESLEVLEPEQLREEMKRHADKMMKFYR